MRMPRVLPPLFPLLLPIVGLAALAGRAAGQADPLAAAVADRRLDDDPSKQGKVPGVGVESPGRADIDFVELYKQLQAAKANAAGLPEGSLNWPTIRVNGKEVPQAFLSVVNLYLSGDAALQSLKMGVAIEREFDRARKSGMDLSHVGLSEEVFRESLDTFKKNIERVYPDMTWDQYLVRNQLTEKGFEAAYRTQVLFETFLTPKDSSKWPPITHDVARSMRPSSDEKLVVEFVENLKKALTTTEPQQASVFLVFMFRNQMTKRLVESVTVKDFCDGIGNGVGFVIDEKSFSIDDLYSRGFGLNGYLESVKAIQFAAIREAVKQAILEREDADWKAAKDAAAASRRAGETVPEPERPKYWLDEGSEAFKAAYAADVAKYPATPPFNHPNMIRYRRFPSIHLYRLYFQMIDAYARMTKKERTLEAIRAHVERDALFFSGGQASIESIGFSSQADPARGTVVGTVEEGFQAARARAERAIADLREGARRADEARAKAKAAGKSDAEAEEAAVEAAKGLTFVDILERDSDYKDAPQRPGMPAPPKSNRGRFGPLMRNPLTDKFAESELTNLLMGYMISEELFFRAPIGEVLGPFRGPTSYYVARVVARTPGGKISELSDEPQRQLAEDDLVNHAFQDFVNGVLAKSKIEIRF